MKYDKSRVRVGMKAISNRGEHLGRVLSKDDQGFIIEKGVFFPKDYLLRYEYVSDVRGDELIYSLDDLRIAERATTATQRPVVAAAQRPVVAAAQRPVAVSAASVGAIPVPAAAAPIRSGDGAPHARRLSADLDTDQEIRLPLRDEEITIEKVNRETGRVRIHKSVRMEERHVTVPVRREEVVVEHLAASPIRGAETLDDDFEEGTIDVIVHEEEVHVSTRPVIREELRVRKVAHEEQRDAAATLRHEEVHVEDTTPNFRAGAARRA
jgi:uncharacterized protein (TIGR02271 family)